MFVLSSVIDDRKGAGSWWPTAEPGYQEQHKWCAGTSLVQWEEVELRQPSLFGSVVWTESANLMVGPVKVHTKGCVITNSEAMARLLLTCDQCVAGLMWPNERLDQTFCFLYVLTWHRGDSSKLLNKRATENQHSIYTMRNRHLYIFGWRNPTLRVMHSQSVSLIVFPRFTRQLVCFSSFCLSTRLSSDVLSASDVLLTLRQRHLQEKKRS